MVSAPTEQHTEPYRIKGVYDNKVLLGGAGEGPGYPRPRVTGVRKLRTPRGATAPKRGTGRTRGNGTETARPPLGWR